MLKNLQKFFILSLILIFIFPNNLYASSFPKTIWKPLDKYKIANESKNNADLIKYGNEVINVMKDAPKTPEKVDLLAPIYYNVAEAYEKTGEYKKAVEFFKIYLPYGEEKGWDDGVKYANAKINILSPIFEVYFEDTSSNNKFYNAKYEPKKGINYGSNYVRDPRIKGFNYDLIKKEFPKKDSIFLIYHVHGEKIGEGSLQNKKFFDEIKSQNTAIEFAYNVNGPLPDIKKDGNEIKKVIDYISNTDIPVYLRFACEMNVNDKWNNPEEYKKYSNLFQIMQKQRKILLLFGHQMT